MTKADAQRITNLKFELEKLANEGKDAETREFYLRWIKAIEPAYEKAQKVLARYN